MKELTGYPLHDTIADDHTIVNVFQGDPTLSQAPLLASIRARDIPRLQQAAQAVIDSLEATQGLTGSKKNAAEKRLAGALHHLRDVLNQAAEGERT